MWSQWKALPISEPEEHRHFIVRYTFDSHSYAVEASDLCSLWEEKIERRKIVQRALNEDTSIDPSEDSRQLQILLQKLEASLNGQEDATLSVAHHDDSSELQLQAEIILPKPLRPLHWTFHLTQASAERVQADVIVPALRRNYMQRLQTEELLGHLKAKDLIITKLIDKLEASGISLASIFPSATNYRGGKKSASREIVSSQIRALGPFDEQKWGGDFNLVSQESPPWTKLVQCAFGLEAAMPSGETTPAQSKHLAGQSPVNAHADGVHAEEEGFMQHQQPPATSTLNQPKIKTDPDTFPNPSNLENDDTTEDEDDLDAPFQQQILPTTPVRNPPVTAAALPDTTTTPANQTPIPNKKLGTIGGPSTTTVSTAAAAAAATATTTTSSQGSSSSITLPYTEQPEEAPTPPPAQTPEKPRPAPKKLGHIGGGGGSSSSSNSHKSTRDPDMPTAAPPSAAAAGPISSTIPEPVSPARAASGADVDSEAPADLESSLQAAVPQSPETTQEKAVRRREELKRELELKRVAAARKKRKF